MYMQDSVAITVQYHWMALVKVNITYYNELNSFKFTPIINTTATSSVNALFYLWRKISHIHHNTRASPDSDSSSPGLVVRSRNHHDIFSQLHPMFTGHKWPGCPDTQFLSPIENQYIVRPSPLSFSVSLSFLPPSSSPPECQSKSPEWADLILLPIADFVSHLFTLIS